MYDIESLVSAMQIVNQIDRIIYDNYIKYTLTYIIISCHACELSMYICTNIYIISPNDPGDDW